MQALLLFGLAAVGVILAGRWLLPMQAVRLQLGALLAADSTTLAPGASANKIALIVANFALTENLAIGDLTYAAFTGATPIAGIVGAQAVGVDPITQAQVIQIKPPAGGYRWICTGGTLPVNIYGCALTDNAGTMLLAVTKFPTPITITAIGQFIEIDPVNMTIIPAPIS